MTMSSIYREHLAKARAALEAAKVPMRRLENAGMILWGRLPEPKKYEGWLCKGPEAHRAFAAWVHADSDVRHWLQLLTSELAKEAGREPVCMPCAETARKMDEAAGRLPTPEQLREMHPLTPAREPLEADEVERRKTEIAAQLAAHVDEEKPPF